MTHDWKRGDRVIVEENGAQLVGTVVNRPLDNPGCTLVEDSNGMRKMVSNTNVKPCEEQADEEFAVQVHAHSDGSVSIQMSHEATQIVMNAQDAMQLALTIIQQATVVQYEQAKTLAAQEIPNAAN